MAEIDDEVQQAHQLLGFGCQLDCYKATGNPVGLTWAFKIALSLQSPGISDRISHDQNRQSPHTK